MEGFGETLAATFGLMLVIEGLAYALFPGAVLTLIERLRDAPERLLRGGGLAALALGTFIVWLVLG